VKFVDNALDLALMLLKIKGFFVKFVDNALDLALMHFTLYLWIAL
jgi:hypothetical protein